MNKVSSLILIAGILPLLGTNLPESMEGMTTFLWLGSLVLLVSAGFMVDKQHKKKKHSS